jgi:peptide/nickel transport system substrate-binding protein
VYVDKETSRPTDFVATKWDVKNDGKTWTFTIRNDIPFQSGNTLTAEDVAYSMRRILRIGLGYSSLWASVLDPEDITVHDKKTVEFATKKQYGPLVATLVQLFIVDSKLLKKHEKKGKFGKHGDYAQEYLERHVAGSGPYTLAEWQTGSRMVFEMFNDYWKGWNPDQFERARMEIVQEESTTELMMKRGKADMTSQFLSTETYQQMKSFDNVRVPEVSQLQLFHLPINTQKKPTDDLNVRKAIAHAFDYNTAVEDIIQGGKVAVGSVPRGMPGHNDKLEPYRQNFEKAKAALNKAKYSVDEINDIGLHVVFVANYPLERKIALLLKDNLKKLGITNVSVDAKQWATITKMASSVKSTPHLTAIFHTAKFPSPDSHTYLMYHPSSFGSYISMSWYSTEQLTQVLEKARSTMDLETRLDTYRKAQPLIVEGYPSVFIANPPYRIGLNKSLGGWEYRGILSFDLRWSSMYRQGSGRAQ